MTIEIDGAQGEGGGQVLRTSLTLATCTGQDIIVKNIRAGRSRPGLLRQHLCAVRSAAAISNATVSGDELASQRVTFSPGAIKAGEYEFKIGSAGSTTLLMQTVMPALLRAEGESRIRLEGGTHNGSAPSVDFVEQAYLPTLARAGVEIRSRLITHGFYPNGGGTWEIAVRPWRSPKPVVLCDRGDFVERRAVIKSSAIDDHIAEREVKRVTVKMQWPAAETEIQRVVSPGPGNIVSLRLRYEHATAIFEAVGALGISAERVAGRAISAAKRYQNGTYPVTDHLADQLLVPMVLGRGGEFVTGQLSEHMRTNIAVIEQIIGRSCIDVHERSYGTCVAVREGLAASDSAAIAR